MSKTQQLWRLSSMIMIPALSILIWIFHNLLPFTRIRSKHLVLNPLQPLNAASSLPLASMLIKWFKLVDHSTIHPGAYLPTHQNKIRSLFLIDGPQHVNYHPAMSQIPVQPSECDNFLHRQAYRAPVRVLHLAVASILLCVGFRSLETITFSKS